MKAQATRGSLEYRRVRSRSARHCAWPLFARVARNHERYEIDHHHYDDDHPRYLCDHVFRARPQSVAAQGTGSRGLHNSDPDPGAGHSRRARRPRPAWASPRRAPARRRRSRCRSCIVSPPTGSRRCAAARVRSCSRRRASLPRRSPRASASTASRLGLTVAVMYGGVPFRPQVNALARGVDILVATPGRLIDHIEQRSREPAGHRDPRARRSRPDARHGLHRTHPQDPRQAARSAPDPVLLGHHAARDRQAGRRDAARSRACRGDARRQDGRSRGAERHPRRAAEEGRAAGRAVLATRP